MTNVRPRQFTPQQRAQLHQQHIAKHVAQQQAAAAAVRDQAHDARQSKVEQKGKSS